MTLQPRGPSRMLPRDGTGPLYFMNSEKRLTRAERWTLAASGVMTMKNGEPFDQLPTQYSTKTIRIAHADWWGIKDRRTQFERMEWLQAEGHRTALRTAVARVSALVQNIGPGEEVSLTKHNEFIVNHLHLLRHSEIIAWDYCRLICVARWGFCAEYLSRVEAWRWMQSAAAVLRRSFESWKGIGDNFVLGYRYWALDFMTDPSVFHAYERLLRWPGSPWNTVAWNIDPAELDGSPPWLASGSATKPDLGERS